MAPPCVRTSKPSLAITCRSRRSVISVVPNASAISATETPPRERTLSAIRRLLSAASIRPMVRHRSTLINSKQKRNSRVDKFDRICNLPLCLHRCGLSADCIRGWSWRRSSMGDARDATRHAALNLGLDLSRRDVLKIAGYSSLAAFIAACGGSTSSGTTTGVTATGGTLSIGSYSSDAAPKAGLQALVNDFMAANGGTKVTINTVDHGTFQNQISSYLQGTPEDVFTWFSGHRMRFFADQGLATPIDDAWAQVKSNYTAGFAGSVTGNDGHVYAIPIDYYPWAVFYRKDVFAAHGYSVPANWDQFKSLCAQMKKDGLIPIAMADKDGWPAQGTFDIINLRLNGYQFHTELLTGKQKWTDPRVTAVYKKWSEITDYYSPGLAGATWQQGADQVVRKQAGMYLLGLFVAQQFAATGNPDDLAQLDFFPFPDLGAQFDAGQAVPDQPRHDPDRKRRRHEWLQRAAEESGAARVQRAEDHAVLRPRLTSRLCGTKRHAELLALFSCQPEGGPDKPAGQDAVVLGLTASRGLARTI